MWRRMGLCSGLQSCRSCGRRNETSRTQDVRNQFISRGDQAVPQMQHALYEGAWWQACSLCLLSASILLGLPARLAPARSTWLWKIREFNILGDWVGSWRLVFTRKAIDIEY